MPLQPPPTRRSTDPDAGGALRAVLFDMDGTLIDSEKMWTLALQRVARDLGGELSAATRMAMVGTDLVSSVQLLHDDIGYTGDLAVTKRLLVAAAAEEFGGPLDWQPGARELLGEVRRAGLATALVTSTHRNLVSMALVTIGRDNFDAVVCGDDVTNTKPHPEPYRRAVAELGVPAAEAIAIEDSPAGSTSARAAGIPTLVVPSELPVPEQPGLVLRPSLAEVDLSTLREIHRQALAGISGA
jgi:HAD superfamily hydrolase (TIGR01509 family)